MSCRSMGQSVWLDYIRRSLITSGKLQRMIDDDDVRGVTSNQSIFEKAVAGSTDYQDVLTAPESPKLDAKALYERIAVARPNLMTKVPAIEEGIPAIRQLIGEGWWRRIWPGLRRSLRATVLSRIASVASFFISRIDSAIDGLITAGLKTVTNCRRTGASSQPDGQSGDRQCEADLPAVSRTLRQPRWQALGGSGRTNPATPVGQHRHQGPQLIET